MGFNPVDRPRSAKAALLERQWDEMCRKMLERETPRQRLDRLSRETQIRRMPVRKLAALWLDASRMGFWKSWSAQKNDK
jgi:hypothetical protein